MAFNFHSKGTESKFNLQKGNFLFENFEIDPFLIRSFTSYCNFIHFRTNLNILILIILAIFWEYLVVYFSPLLFTFFHVIFGISFIFHLWKKLFLWFHALKHLIASCNLPSKVEKWRWNHHFSWWGETSISTF